MAVLERHLVPCITELLNDTVIPTGNIMRCTSSLDRPMDLIGTPCRPCCLGGRLTLGDSPGCGGTDIRDRVRNPSCIVENIQPEEHYYFTTTGLVCNAPISAYVLTPTGGSPAVLFSWFGASITYEPCKPYQILTHGMLTVQSPRELLLGLTRFGATEKIDVKVECKSHYMIFNDALNQVGRTITVHGTPTCKDEDEVVGLLAYSRMPIGRINGHNGRILHIEISGRRPKFFPRATGTIFFFSYEVTNPRNLDAAGIQFTPRGEEASCETEFYSAIFDIEVKGDPSFVRLEMGRTPGNTTGKYGDFTVYFDKIEIR